jgi:hypothetical protein
MAVPNSGSSNPRYRDEFLRRGDRLWAGLAFPDFLNLP